MLQPSKNNDMPVFDGEVPLPVLITGISGVAGYNALYCFRALWGDRVIGLTQPDNRRLHGPGIVHCDANDRRGLGRLFDRYGFRAVLNCAGNCALKSCELDPAMARRINVTGVETLLDVIAGRDVRLVHLSIDLVFSGEGLGGYTEDAPADPVTIYGRTMLAAEERVAAADPRACVLRISLPMGVSANGHAGAIDWIQSRFRQGKPATLYFDEVRTPTYTDCLSRLSAEALARDWAGLYHAGGPRPLSLYQIAQVVNRVGGYDPRLLIGCPRREAGPIPPRAGNVALDSSRLAAELGAAPFRPWPADRIHVPTHRQWHFERPTEEARGVAELARVLYGDPARPGFPRPPGQAPRRHQGRPARVG